jgi:hypothetical protein
MASEFTFLGSDDKPALLAVSAPPWAALAQSCLESAGYKVHAPPTFEQFTNLYTRASYQVVVIEDAFGGGPENPALRWVQALPMSQRRNAVFFLIGEKLETLDPFCAFQQSVHAVINYSAFDQFKGLVEKTVADNQTFLRPLHSAQERILKAV